MLHAFFSLHYLFILFFNKILYLQTINDKCSKLAKTYKDLNHKKNLNMSFVLVYFSYSLIAKT